MRSWKPILCLDTNAEIDLGTIAWLDKRKESVDDHYKEVIGNVERMLQDSEHDYYMREISRRLGDRRDQLLNSYRFSELIKEKATVQILDFARVEVDRLRTNGSRAPSQISQACHVLAIDVFSASKLNLQDALIFASAVIANGDALVTSDEDFRGAFSEDQGVLASLALKYAGKPLCLIDHRRIPTESTPTVFDLIIESLKQYYKEHIGRPRYVGQIQGSNEWYVAYDCPILPAMQFRSIVPGRDRVSIVHSEAWITGNIVRVGFGDKEYSEGLTPETLPKMLQDYAKLSEKDKTKTKWVKLRNNTAEKIVVALVVDGQPPNVEDWKRPTGERARVKYSPPERSVAFVHGQ